MLLSATPKIANIIVATSASVPAITWNVADSAGFASTDIGMTVDGAAVTVGTVAQTPATKADFWGLLGSSDLLAGTHKYVITATDANDATSSSTGTYTIIGVAPTISLGTVTASTINWTVSVPSNSGAGIQSSTVTVNGAYPKVAGPSNTTSNGDQTIQASYSATSAAMQTGSKIVITATSTSGITTAYSTTYGVAGAGPVISNLVIAPSAATPVITWNVNTNGRGGPIGSCSMTVDGAGVTVPVLSGINSANYWGLLSPTLSVGNHTFVITATAANGTATTYSGTFTVVGGQPAISSVVVDTSAAIPVITWNAQASAGIKSSAITLDGMNLSVCGPYGGSTNANYAGLLGNLSGNHTYTYAIAVTGNDGTSATLNGTFSVS